MTMNKLNLDEEGPTSGDMVRAIRDAIDLASDQNRGTWLTDAAGKRLAAIVPVDVAEAGEAVLDMSGDWSSRQIEIQLTGAPPDRIDAWKAAGWTYVGATEDGAMFTAPFGTGSPQ